LLGDAVRVLTRTMKNITQVAGAAGAKLHDRTRSVRHRLVEIGRASRSRSEQGKDRLQACYQKLLSATSRVVGQAKQFAREVAAGVKCGASLLEQIALEAHRAYLETMIPRVQQVMRQTRERILKGNARVAGKLVSLFEAHTEIIRKGKAAKPTEFGKMVKIQEAEQQIITHYEVYDERPSDAALLIPALDAHEQQLGRTPHLITADAGFFSGQNEATAHARGVKRISIPNRSTKSAERKKLQKKRWFRNAQKWRTGCEGRISLLKRRHGLNRCRYRGQSGMKRWVGFGVIGDNLINIGRTLAAAAKT
jgi:IS5 family transposase